MQLRITLLTTVLLLLLVPTAQGQVVVSGDITTSTTWTAANEYVLDGLVFVDAGATLTIEPGTVIKARAQGNITTGEGASALIVRRGARLVADGRRESPIIFTSEFDDVEDAEDLTEQDRGLWGGVLLLGRAPTNNNAALTQIEGIPPEQEAQYGGSDPADDSGVLRYVSIRHGGFSISGVSGDEINGLTMGAVGAGTVIEYVEVFANLDDCFEWFGGTVDTKYLVGAFCGDDTFDYDQGYRGRGQFWFAVQGDDQAGRGAEMDGTDPAGGAIDDATFSQVIVSNATFIGSGESAEPNANPEGDQNDFALRFRENAGGQYVNSVFTDFTGDFVRIDEGDTDPDAVDRFQAGDLVLENNVVFGFGGGATFADLVRTADGVTATLAQALADRNTIADPALGGISRVIAVQGLDPRPHDGSPLLTLGTSFEGAFKDAFFEPVAYVGAFGSELWTDQWTALSQNGVTGDLVDNSVAVEPVDGAVPGTFELAQNYPNPFNPATEIQFAVERAQRVRLAVYDLLGREVAVLVDGVQPAGTFRATFDGQDLASGTYLYRLTTERGSVAKTMTLAK